MSSESRYMRCERVVSNNGIVQVVFKRDAGHYSQEEHVLINWLVFPDRFREGETYQIEISMASQRGTER